MKKSISLLGSASLLVLGSAFSGFAADLVADPVPAPEVIEARISGAFEVGFVKMRYYQTDDDRGGHEMGYYGSAFMHLNLNPIVFGLDFQTENFLTAEDNDWEDYTATFHNVWAVV